MSHIFWFWLESRVLRCFSNLEILWRLSSCVILWDVYFAFWIYLRFKDCRRCHEKDFAFGGPRDLLHACIQDFFWNINWYMYPFMLNVQTTCIRLYLPKWRQNIGHVYLQLLRKVPWEQNLVDFSSFWSWRVFAIVSRFNSVVGK